MPNRALAYFVRPLAGAGIEITKNGFAPAKEKVRPLAGAGIEIVKAVERMNTILFAPSRGRELK